MKKLLALVVVGAAACGVASEPDGPDRGTADVTSDAVAADAVAADVDAEDSGAAPDAPVLDAGRSDVPGLDAESDSPTEAQDTLPDGTDVSTDGPSEADVELDSERDAQADVELDSEPDAPLVPPEDCIGVTPEFDHGAPSAGDGHECPTCLGEPAPNWVLYDFQPLSCGAGSHYGLDQFQGRPTMLVLLSAGCSYCLSQTVKLEEMWWELTGEGHEFNFVVVNLASMASRRSNLTDRAGFPMFQDTPELDIWGVQGGRKDDFYFYDAEGILRAFYPARGTVETYLSSEEGYGNVRDAMLHLLGEDVALPADGDGSLPDEEGGE